MTQLLRDELEKLHLSFHKAYDYQTRQGDGLLRWASIHKVARFFDYLIIYSLMENEKRISNSKCPMDTKIDRVLSGL